MLSLISSLVFLVDLHWFHYIIFISIWIYSCWLKAYIHINKTQIDWKCTFESDYWCKYIEYATYLSRINWFGVNGDHSFWNNRWPNSQPNKGVWTAMRHFGVVWHNHECGRVTRCCQKGWITWLQIFELFQKSSSLKSFFLCSGCATLEVIMNRYILLQLHPSESPLLFIFEQLSKFIL